MRIRVDDDGLRDELAAALHGAGCAIRTSDNTLEISHAELPGDPLELRFFVRAWLARHPDARAELV